MWQFFSHIWWFPYFFSHIWPFHPHIVQFQHHMWQFFSHIWWFPYFFLTFDGSILTLCSSNITCDNSFLIFGGSLIFFLTFDGSILTLCSSNVTCDSFFSHLVVPLLLFFSHLTVPSSHFAVLTSHMTVFLSHWVVSLLFSHTWRFHPHIVQFQHHMRQLFSHIWWFPYFFLTFDCSILILCSSNITCDSFFSHLVVSLLSFSHIWHFYPHIVRFQHHIW